MSTLTPRFAEHVEQFHNALRHHCSNVQLHSKDAYTNFHDYLQQANIHPKAVLYAGGLVITLVWLNVKLAQQYHTRKDFTPPQTPTHVEKASPFKAPERLPGGNLFSYTSLCQSS
jgi:hypothetical protein